MPDPSCSAISEFSSLDSAKDSCISDSNCLLIYDAVCDGKLYHTCSTDMLVASSSIGSCVYVKQGKQ